MNRQQLEHVLRAAGVISEDRELIVIGSQAILGQFPSAPPPLLVSMEVDLYPKNRPERSDLIDGSIGEGSPFHETFGYYGQGVGPETAVLPNGWEQRLVRVQNENTLGFTGWCLEAHDLVVSKCIAGREKDRRFLEAAHQAGLVELAILRERLSVTTAHEDLLSRARAWVDQLEGQSH